MNILSYLDNFFIDTDECLDGIDKCHTDAECSDTDGSYLCVCHDGYAGDGYNCTGTLDLPVDIIQVNTVCMYPNYSYRFVINDHFSECRY